QCVVDAAGAGTLWTRSRTFMRIARSTAIVSSSSVSHPKFSVSDESGDLAGDAVAEPRRGGAGFAVTWGAGSRESRDGHGRIREYDGGRGERCVGGLAGVADRHRRGVGSRTSADG